MRKTVNFICATCVNTFKYYQVSDDDTCSRLLGRLAQSLMSVSRFSAEMPEPFCLLFAARIIVFYITFAIFFVA